MADSPSQKKKEKKEGSKKKSTKKDKEKKKKKSSSPSTRKSTASDLPSSASINVRKRGLSDTALELEAKEMKNNATYYLDGIRAPATCYDYLVKLNEDMVGAPESWMATFVEPPSLGIEVLMDVLNEKQAKERKTGTDTVVQIECLKALEYLVENCKAAEETLSVSKLKSLSLVLANGEDDLQARVMQLLAFICLLPPKGSDLVHEAMSFFGNHVKESQQFAFLVNILKKENASVDSLTHCFSLINSLVSCPEDLEDRMKYREAFVKLGILDTIKDFRATWAVEHEQLETQLTVFEEEMGEDEKQQRIWMGSRIGGVPKNDPSLMFQHLLKNVQTSPYLPSFLSVLQTFTHVTTSTDVGLQGWKGFETVVKKYYLLTDKAGFEDQLEVMSSSQLDNLARLHDTQVKGLTRKLKQATDELQEAKSELEKYKKGALAETKAELNAVLAPAPPGPPPPGDAPPPPAGGPPPPPPPGGGPPHPPGGAPPPPGGPPPPPGGTPQAPGGGLPPKPVVKPSCKMKQFNWSKLPNDKVGASYWKNLSDANVKLDTTDLEALFSAKEIPKKVEEDKAKEAKPTTVTLLEMKRANNCAIMLSSRFKGTSYEVIKNAIMTLDENVLRADVVENLLMYCPTPEEIEILNNYDEDKSRLGAAEQYFLVVKDIPRLQHRLRAFQFKLKYQEVVDEIKPDVDAVLAAVSEVEKSKKLKNILEIILAIGNYLNGSTPRGQAYGFKLEALKKLRDTKSADNQTTLLHYIVQLVEKQDEDALAFSKDLKHVAPAARVSLPTIVANIGQLKQGFKQVEAELAQSTANDPKDKFKELMTEFLQKKEKQFEQLETDVKTMEDDFNRLAGLFGEPKSCTPDQLFGTLAEFIDSFERTRREQEQKKAAAEKKAAAAASGAVTTAATKVPPRAGPAIPGGMGDMLDQMKKGSFFRHRREAAGRGAPGAPRDGRGAPAGRGEPSQRGGGVMAVSGRGSPVAPPGERGKGSGAAEIMAEWKNRRSEATGGSGVSENKGS